ncbi:putative scp-like extracellular protein [Golovinomyces cichoracearum]|uniref:Putative scp-like extracellular protein n=1 Tax=Golovinomyces cichoracearum TaxID=62708 RepID=A0A420IJE6_9PEZI|nr:putative scp-like extracellular protein [Golovinomyces cichoracearum]
MFLQKYIHFYTSSILFFITIFFVTSSPVTIVVKREIEVIVEVVTCTVTVTVFEVPSSSVIDENIPKQAILPLKDSDAVQDSLDFLKFNESKKDATPLASPTKGNVSDDIESSIVQDISLKNLTLDSSAISKSSDNQDNANTSNPQANSEPIVIEDFSKVPEPPTFNKVPKQQEDPAFINVPKIPESPAFNEAPKQQEAPAFINVPKIPKSPAFNEAPKQQEAPAFIDVPKIPESPAFNEAPKKQEAPAFINVPNIRESQTINEAPKAPEFLPTPKSTIKNKSPDIEKSVPVASDNGKNQDFGSSKVSPPQDISDFQDTSKDQDREITPDSKTKKKKPGFSSKVLSDYEATTIERHNAHRFNHSSIELTWNKTLASFALETAKTCVFAHDLTPGDGNYGQNIAAFGTSKGVKSLDKSTLIADAVSNKWYNSELKFVPFGISKPSTSGPEFLHLTQIIWKETKSVGCVTFECPSGSIFSIPSQYTVCNYFPAGNIMGKFDEQISRPLGQKTIIATIA